MYHIMKQDSAQAGGYKTVARVSTRAKAEKLAKAHDTKLNGRPMGLTRILSEIEYSQWHKESIAPYYMEGTA